MPVVTRKQLEKEMEAGALKAPVTVSKGEVQQTTPLPVKAPATAVQVPQVPMKTKWQQPYVLEHPDSTAGSPITATFTMAINGEPVKVEIDRGRVETKRDDLRDLLMQSGYRWMNEV